MYKTAIRNKHHSREEYDLYEDLAKIKDAFSDTATHAKDKATEMISESIVNAKDKWKERSADLQEKFTNNVSENPYRTVGYSLLFGLLVGYLLRGRRE